MKCENCSEEMQKLCAAYPASYSCGEDAVAYRAEMKKNSDIRDSDFISEEAKQ